MRGVSRTPVRELHTVLVTVEPEELRDTIYDEDLVAWKRPAENLCRVIRAGRSRTDTEQRTCAPSNQQNPHSPTPLSSQRRLGRRLDPRDPNSIGKLLKARSAVLAGKDGLARQRGPRG
jgi:hypothetical protein